MLVLITKASDDYWYEFKEVNTLEEVLKIAPRVVIETNCHTEDEVEFWEGFKKEDIPKLKQAKINIMIYDSWIE